MRLKIFLSALALTMLAYTQPMAAVQDSTGTTVKNGKVYIMHKVEKSQGLYAISRRYNVPLADIVTANPGSDKMLYVDQIILVPTKQTASKEDKVVKEYFAEDRKPTFTKEVTPGYTKTTSAKYHTVMAGETLFSIATKHNTTVEIIKNLNSLPSNDLTIGQALMIPVMGDEKEAQKVAIAKTEEKIEKLENELEEVKTAASEKSKKNDRNKTEMVEETTVKTSSYERKVEHIEDYDFDKIWEKGSWILYTEDDGGKGRVCSHHSAEIGTTVMVTNPENKKAVFVKVIANHTMDANQSNMIKLSDAAIKYIGLQQNKVVEVSFGQ
ncbi:MAG: LysM repeat protein [Bacteroidia bacterium]|jgi:LysM repeat protein